MGLPPSSFFRENSSFEALDLPNKTFVLRSALQSKNPAKNHLKNVMATRILAVKTSIGYKCTFEMYGISLNLESLKALSPSMKRANKGVSFRGIFSI